MSGCVDVASEQVYYIPCNFCNIILANKEDYRLSIDVKNPSQKKFEGDGSAISGALYLSRLFLSSYRDFIQKHLLVQVSVPCSSLFDIVTVRCGHCTNLWSVNMAAALQSLSWQEIQMCKAPNFTSPDYRIDLASSSRCNRATKPPLASNEGRTDVNRPPEKRQRVPSAYNQFIKEEIQRLKAKNPEISHREAFSTAAKNWAHFPNIHFGLMLETNNNKQKLDEGAKKHLMT